MSDKITDGFKSLLGEPIEKHLVQRWHQYYIDSSSNGTRLNLPYGYTISEQFINAVRQHEEVNGIELIVIAYDEPGKSPHNHTPYKKNDISVVLAPVANGKVLENLLYDYTDPCRPPCSRLDAFKKKKP